MYTESISKQNISTFKYTNNFQQPLSSGNNSINSFGNNLSFLPEKKSLGRNRSCCNTQILKYSKNNDLEFIESKSKIELNIDEMNHKKIRARDYKIMSIKKQEKLLYGKSSYFCGYASHTNSISLESDLKGNSNCCGTSRCNSIYQCNVCQQRILSRRQKELEIINKSHLESGGGVYLLTLTVKHSMLDSFESLLGSSKNLSGLLGAYSYLVSKDRGFKKLLENYGVQMSCRAFESTWGQTNGYHVHLHCLYYTSRQLTDKEMQSFPKEFYKLWVNAIDKAGLKIPNKKHGVDFQDGSNAGKYIAKWSSSNELSSVTHKKAKDGNFTINELENLLIEKTQTLLPTDKLKSVLKNYYKGCYGKRFLTWSDRKFLRKKYLSSLNELEQTDNQILENSNIESKLKVSIGSKTYNDFYKLFKIHELRTVFELNKCDGILKLAKKLGISTYDIHLIFDETLTEENKLELIKNMKLEYGFFPDFENDLEKRDYFILNYHNLISIANDFYVDNCFLENKSNIYYPWVLDFCIQYKNKIILDNTCILVT